MPRIDAGGDGGEQVDDRLGRGLPYRGEQSVPVERVGGDDVRADPFECGGAAGAAGQSDHVVANGGEQGNETATDDAARSGNENTHDDGLLSSWSGGPPWRRPRACTVRTGDPTIP